LAIVSAAIATFALTLFDSLIVEKKYLVIGVALLLLIVMISFAHLIGRLDKGFKSLNKLRECALPPIKSMTRSCVDFFQGKITVQEWIQKEEEFKKVGGGYDIITQGVSSISSKTSQVSHSDSILITIFIVAISIIIYSFLKPILLPIVSDKIFEVFFMQGVR
jgi:hypothetical protein